MREKVQSKFYFCITCVAALIFSSVYLSIFFNSIRKEHLIVPCIALLIVCYVMITKIKNTSWIFRCCFCCMIIIQLFFGYFLMVEYSTWDVFPVVKNAREIVQGTYKNAAYYARYPNNVGLMVLFAGVFSITDMLWGTTSVYFLVVLNIVAIDIAVVLIVQIVKQLFCNAVAYRVGICLTGFAPLYLYVPICYTDTFAMPLLMGIAFLVVRIVKTYDERSLFHNSIVAFGLGVFLMLGMKIKATLIISLIAATLYFVFTIKMKATLHVLTAALAGMLIVSLAWSWLVEPIVGITDELLDKHKFPVYHWIAMGLEGHGNYNDPLVKYTASFQTYAERVAATLEKITEQVQDLGFSGVLQQFHKKAVSYGWNFGTCYAERYIGDAGDSPRLINVLHDFFLSKGKYHEGVYIVTQSIWLIHMGFAMSGFIKNIFRKNYHKFFMHLLIIGCMIFFMIWETHPRYILHYSLFVVASGVIELDNMVEWCTKYGSWLVRKLKGIWV